MARRRAPAGGLVRGMVRAWYDDNVADSAAALTFYAVLSFFPFLLCLVALGGLVLDERDIAQVTELIGRVAPPPVLELVRHRLAGIERVARPHLLGVGMAGALWAASGAVRSLTRALDRAYDVHETRALWKRWLLALAVTVAAGAVVLLDVALLFALPSIARLLPSWCAVATRWTRYPIAGAAMMTLWALLYWAVPNVRNRAQRVLPGAVAGVIVWLGASWLLGVYLRHSLTWDASYGALGGVIALLFWTWLSLVILLMGAELNRLLTPRRLADTATGERASGRGPQPAPA